MNITDTCELLLRLSPDDLLGYFYYNRNAIKDYRVVLFSNISNNLPNKFKNIVSNSISLLSLSPESDFFVLDYDTVAQTFLRNGKSDIQLLGCVHFDTQIVSYLNQIYDDKTKDTPVYDTYTFLRKILEEKLDFTNDLYLIENAFKTNDAKTFEKMKDCLLSYAHYKETTPKQFESDFGKRNIFNINDHKFVDETINDIDILIKKSSYIQNVFNSIYCILLKLACIEFSSNKSPKNKFLALNSFMINELGIYLERELAICYFYLYKKDNVKTFFKKFQKNSKNLIDVIQGMTWDLAHIRTIEIFMAQDQKGNKYFSNHYMVTYDRGLRDILISFPLDRIVFYNGYYREIFKQPLALLVEDIDLTKLYDETIELRENVRKNRNLIKLKQNLIEDLNKILGK